MIPLRITAHLSTPLVAFDDWSPMLDSILEAFWLMDRGLYSTNPDPKQIIKADLPLQEGSIQGEWYWCSSAPCYTYEFEQPQAIRKRWDMQEYNLDWQGKRKAWSSSEGHSKSFEKIYFERNPSCVTWFAVGNPDPIAALLRHCDGIGFKRYAKVWRWEVEPFEHDWHLWGPHGQLMRPIPYRLLPERAIDFRPLRWGWRPPYRMVEMADDCALPVFTVHKLGVQL